MNSTAGPPALFPGPDEDWGYKLKAVFLSTFIAAGMATLARLYVRTRVVKNVGLDDWLMLLAVLMALGATISGIVGTSFGLGRHNFYLSSFQVAQVNLTISLTTFFCAMALAVGKISICVTLLRILKNSMARNVRCLIWLLIFLLLTVNFVCAVYGFVQCTPTIKSWDRSVPGTCLPTTISRDLQYLRGSFSAFTDFLLSLLPIMIFYHIKIVKRQKIALLVVMGFGFLTGIVAIIRTTYLEPYADFEDASFTNINVLIWGGVERNMAIMLASFPALLPLVQSWSILQGRSDYRRYPGILPSNQKGLAVPSDEMSAASKEKYSSSDNIARSPHAWV